MRKIIAILLMTSVSGSALAALPPIHDSVKQYMAVLSSTEVLDLLNVGSTIASISSKGESYTVITDDNCGVTVGLEAVLPDYEGPTEYKVNSVSPLRCEK